ncbi:MAG: MBL fold metallo-hydrolase [Patescibacteria group bacterium]
MKLFSFGGLDSFSSCSESPSFCVENNETKVLIDAPVRITSYLRELNLSLIDLSAVIITHLHNDHVEGLTELIQLRMLLTKFPEKAPLLGFMKKEVTEKLTVYVFGNDFSWFRDVKKIVERNCPTKWGCVDDYVEWRFVADTKGVLQIGDCRFEFCKNEHDVFCVGLKINGFAISGDTPFEEEFENWLWQNSKIIFHELGGGGCHTLMMDLPKLREKINDQKKLFFYHVPEICLKILEDNGFAVVQKRGYEV